MRRLIGLAAISVLIVGSGAVVYWGLHQGNTASDIEGFTSKQVQQALTSSLLLEYREVQELLARLRTLPPQDRLPREEVLQPLLRLLTNPYAAVRAEIAQALAKLKIKSAVPYVLEVLQFETPLSPTHEQLVSAYRELSGVPWSYDIDGWAREFERWWSAHPQAPEEFIAWKVQLYRNLVPSFEEFLYPDVTHTIPLETVVWGGVPKDGIPALNNPEIVSAVEASYLDDEEMIFGVLLNGETRAYPLRFLDWHELVNDEVGGEPVTLSDCTLCGSAILYSRRVGDRVLTFGTSGLLFKSNKLMYDAETKTLWINFLGKPVVGPLAAQEDLRLKALPLTQTTWAYWKEEHPTTTVLASLIEPSRPGRARIIGPGGVAPYTPGSAYREYRESSETFFPVVGRDERLAPKEWVFGLLLNGQAKAYPIKLLQKRVLNDSVAAVNVVIIAEAEAGRMDYWKQGGAVRTYARGEHSLTRGADGEIRDETGQLWKTTEDFLQNEATGEKLLRLNGHKAYWFAWVAFYPATLLYRETEP